MRGPSDICVLLIVLRCGHVIYTNTKSSYFTRDLKAYTLSITQIYKMTLLVALVSMMSKCTNLLLVFSWANLVIWVNHRIL